MTSKPVPTAAVLTIIAGMTLLLAACAKDLDTSAGRQPNSTGSAAPASTARPQPPPTTSGSPPPSCSYDGGPVIIRTGEQPTPICVHPGDAVTLSASPSSTQLWQSPISSDPTILRCESRPLAGGALTSTCHALRLGTATVSSTTAAFAGDPHGPPQYTWTLTVHIVPAR